MCDYSFLYPIMVIQDRYGGCYSKAKWLAVANFWEDRPDEFENGPNGGDTDAICFWAEPPDWIGGGATPDGALDALMAKNPGKRPRV